LLNKKIIKYFLMLGAVVPALAHAEEIARLESARGQVRLVEDAGVASLITAADGSIRLPSDWRQVDITMVSRLNNRQTALILAYADRTCAAKQALLVITPTRIWGPYAIGACEQAMAYQVTANEDALVAMPADGRSRNAWVYSSDDSALRGPARISLPDNLARLAGPAADTASAPAVKPASPPPPTMPAGPVAVPPPPIAAPAKPAAPLAPARRAFA